jgi:hypothetical protein
VRALPEPVTVQKLNFDGSVQLEWTGHVLERTERGVVLEALFNHTPRDLGYVSLRPGDRFVEHYYTDRWYNVFAIYDADGGAFKGWYCNVTRPAEIISAPSGAGLQVRAVDLALDYFRQPGGREFVLGEGGFAAVPLSPDDVTAARAALAELKALAASGAGPFATGVGTFN